MRPIPTKIHGILDYIGGLLFILSPWIFDFADGEAAQWVPVFVGATVLVVSLITDYEFSVVKKVPMSTHLAIDVMGGGLLAASPWLFGFSEWVFWPHLLFGMFEIGAGLLTRQVPDYRFSGDITEPEDSSAYKRGDVINLSDRHERTDHGAQRHMTKDEELNEHIDKKEQQRTNDNLPHSHHTRRTKDDDPAHLHN